MSTHLELSALINVESQASSEGSVAVRAEAGTTLKSFTSCLQASQKKLCHLVLGGLLRDVSQSSRSCGNAMLMISETKAAERSFDMTASCNSHSMLLNSVPLKGLDRDHCTCDARQQGQHAWTVRRNCIIPLPARKASETMLSCNVQKTH